MIGPFVEGARSIVQPCQLVILAPVVAAVVAGRARWQVVVAAMAGVILGGWFFIARWAVLDETAIRWSSLLVIAAAAALAMRRAGVIGGSGDSPTGHWIDASAAGMIALVVTTWWRPCVGEELGELLTRGPDEPWRALPGSWAYMLGVSLPILAIGLIAAAWNPGASAARRAGWAGAAVCATLAGTVVIGQHGEIVATLFEWSQP